MSTTPVESKLDQWPDACHDSHELRSTDSSYSDVVCVHCNHTDVTGGGWGKLRMPCPATPSAGVSEAEVEAFREAYAKAYGHNEHYLPCSRIRAALEAAARVREGTP